MAAPPDAQPEAQSEEEDPLPDDQLQEHEIYWRDKQGFLEKHGYMLRQRFRPGWVPSWIGSKRPPDLHEDNWPLPLRANLIDATRMSDGKLVFIKVVETNGKEMEISTFFSQPPQRDDPRNHCVPIWDTFADNDDPAMSYIIMPYLRLSDDPPFLFVDDAVGFVDQIIEGLVFIHEHNVAHRDCTLLNLMMDADGLFPKGYHPQHLDFLPDMSARAPHVSRVAAHTPVKYYYIDFGMSSKFASDDGSRLVTGIDGLDRDVPELSRNTPYDPFKLDIFIVGNVLRKHFLSKYTNVDFLTTLVELMTQLNPDARPSAPEALDMWRRIRKRVWSLQRVRRLRPQDKTSTGYLLKDMSGLFVFGLALSQRFLRKPFRSS